MKSNCCKEYIHRFSRNPADSQQTSWGQKP